MNGRIWLVLGVIAGIAVGIARVPYVAGAAGSLSDTAQRIVGSAGLALIHSSAKSGAPERVVEGFSAILGLLVPGLAALLLVAVARLSLRLRILVGVLVVIFGAAGYRYLADGPATGALLLALGAAAVAVLATGPLVAAPLAALAALIGTRFLPRLVSGGRSVPRSAVVELHRALFASPGSPLWLEILVLVAAAVPFALAARLVVR